jgi:hypothetical protein
MPTMIALVCASVISEAIAHASSARSCQCFDKKRLGSVRQAPKALGPKEKGPAQWPAPQAAYSQPLVTTGGGGALPLPT